MAPPTTLPLTAREALRLGAEHLAKAGNPSAQLDMSLILAHTLGLDRLRLYADLDRVLNDAERTQARDWLGRRLKHEPISYLIGEREFFGLALEVDRETLIPRPETEHLVETALAWIEAETAAMAEDAPPLILADIGTGSGAIAIAGAHGAPKTRWIAADISEGALNVARRNAARHEVAARIEFRLGADYAPFAETLDAILSNPPYIARSDEAALQPDVALWEPHAALFSGVDGMDCLRQLIAGAPAQLRPGGLIALECGAGQAEIVAGLLKATGAFERIERARDLAGIERVVHAIRAPEDAS